MSCLGVMYGNLTSISEERDSMRNKRNEIKREADGKQTKSCSLYLHIVLYNIYLHIYSILCSAFCRHKHILNTV